MCGISWGVFQVFPIFLHSSLVDDLIQSDKFNIFQTLSTSYACEVVPTVLRPYVTAYVCMCWGAGILLSSGVVRAVASLEGDIGWRLPFAIQWVWPIPLLIGAYLAPESPWNAVRRGQINEAREALLRLRQDTPNKERDVDATLAYIRYTTELEKAETDGASIWDCFKGANLRRTEIVSCSLFYVFTNHFNDATVKLTRELQPCRTVSSGLHRSSAVTPFWVTRLPSSRPPASPQSRPLT